ncbi:MAG TPA: histidine phosphatase family protein [Nitrososphaera sp.]|nr:histidine phosphatase family protein [Nitrososphaera sp.]
MKTLFVLRHAKSSWEDADLADFDRPLNERGKGAARFMGKLMHGHGFQPEIILASPAVRARRTAAVIMEAGELRGILQFEPRIYEASPRGLRQVVSEMDDSIASLMIVGHNPGIESFILYLTGNLEPMPTAALAVIDVGIDEWNAISEGSGKLRRIFRPKDEMK